MMPSFRTVMTLLGALICSTAWSVGGVWVLEIDFQYQGHRAHGYLEADYWAADWDAYVRKDAEFQEVFATWYGKQGDVLVFEQLTDRSELAEKATFPMHPFELDRTSGNRMLLQDMAYLSLRKVWVRDDYHIEVLTGVSLADTTWVSRKAEVSHPIGEEVGCRLEVHNYSGRELDPGAMQQLVQAYQQPDSREDGFTYFTRLNVILSALKQDHVVVVELCGC